MEILFQVHSSIRYLVLLIGVVTAGYLFVALIRRTPFGAGARVMSAIFTGLLDLQVLLGLLLMMSLPVYPALYGHLVMMMLAAVVAHAGSIVNRRRPAEQQSNVVALVSVALTLLLLVGGISAIGRDVV